MKKNKNSHGNKAPHKQPGFSGYTMAELKYQRALVALKKEYLKEDILYQTADIKRRIPFLNRKKKTEKKSSGLFGKMMKGLDYSDYIMLGAKGFGIIKKAGSLFRKKKK